MSRNFVSFLSLVSFFSMGKRKQIECLNRTQKSANYFTSPLLLTSLGYFFSEIFFVVHLQRTDEFETCHLKLGMCWIADNLTKRPRSQKVSTHILLKFLWRNLHQAYISVHSRFEIQFYVFLLLCKFQCEFQYEFQCEYLSFLF